MKTTLIAVLFLFAFTALNFAQETGASFTETIKPITIKKVDASQTQLLRIYSDLIADILLCDRIDQSKKDEALSWEPTVKVLDGQQIKAVLQFPQGSLAIDYKGNTYTCLSKEFNSWAGENQDILDFINPFYISPKQEILYR